MVLISLTAPAAVQTGASRRVTTGTDGRNALGTLQTGTYEVRSELNGVHSLVRSGIAVA